MINKLISFNLNCGRMGDLNGLFVVDAQEWETLERLQKSGAEVHFGEVLGKHSDICSDLKGTLTIITEDQDIIGKLVSACNGKKTISGCNPLHYEYDEVVDALA